MARTVAEHHVDEQPLSTATSSALEDCTVIPPEPIPDDGSGDDTRDPFGFRGVAADPELIRQAEGVVLRRKGWGKLARLCPNCRWLFTAADKVLRLLSAKPKVIGWNSEENRVPATAQKEEFGVRQAAGMTKSWTRPELVACYVLFVPTPRSPIRRAPKELLNIVLLGWYSSATSSTSTPSSTLVPWKTLWHIIPFSGKFRVGSWRFPGSSSTPSES